MITQVSIYNVTFLMSRQRWFSTQCILIAELDDVRSERGGDCFQPKRHCGISFRTYVGDWGDVLVFYIYLEVCTFANGWFDLQARNAAIANSYFTCAINRVGTETFPRWKQSLWWDSTSEWNKTQSKSPNPPYLTRSSFQGIYLWRWGSRPQVSILDMTFPFW